MFTVPANTSSPTLLFTGIASPVSMLSFMAEFYDNKNQ
jgi:hypothetical protein